MNVSAPATAPVSDEYTGKIPKPKQTNAAAILRPRPGARLFLRARSRLHARLALARLRRVVFRARGARAHAICAAPHAVGASGASGILLARRPPGGRPHGLQRRSPAAGRRRRAALARPRRRAGARGAPAAPDLELAASRANTGGPACETNEAATAGGGGRAAARAVGCAEGGRVFERWHFLHVCSY